MKFILEENKKTYSWYTNGEIDIKVYEDEIPPEGFYHGRHYHFTPWNKGLSAKDDERVRLNTEKAHKTLSLKYHPAWNKGLTKEDPRVQNNITKAQQTIKSKYGVDNISQYFTQQDGYTVWNKGLTKEINNSVKKISTANIGRTPWNKGQTKDTDPRITTHSMSDETRQHLRDIHLSPEFQKARYDKMITNNTLCVHDSIAQQKFYQELLRTYSQDEIKKEYFDKERYPFKCDFYIVPEDLFIELHINWTHGGKPYDPNDRECQEKLKIWQEKAKTSKFYQNAIYTWTDLDVRKAETAKKNNLNFRALYKI